MEWLIFLAVNLIIVLTFVPLGQWKRLWPAGLVGVVLLYLIDLLFYGLDTYAYSYGIRYLAGLPLFYLISGFPQSVFLAYLCPSKKQWRFPYILLMAAILWSMELIMFKLGFFQYHRWNLGKSYLLNIIGLTVLITYSQWLGAVGRGEQEQRSA